jgi:hypothetical protein
MINMSIIRKLLGRANVSGGVSPIEQLEGQAAEQKGLNQRLQDIYGQEKIDLQILYEKWVVKDTWLLKHEALPLLSGIDPERNDAQLQPELLNNINQLWIHSKDCVEQGLLKVINQEQADENWRVSPLDIYRWARISRMELPDVFTRVMEFISKTVKQPDLQPVSKDKSGIDYDPVKFDENREKVLGIALALLAAYPEKCKDSLGQVKADRIVNLIIEKSESWLVNEPQDFSTTAIRDLINKWLNTLPSFPDTIG